MGDTVRDKLKKRVIALVKEFIKTEGGITLGDLEALFGLKDQTLIAAYLRKIMKITA